jgi:hypothetical protein
MPARPRGKPAFFEPAYSRKCAGVLRHRRVPMIASRPCVGHACQHRGLDYSHDFTGLGAKKPGMRSPSASVSASMKPRVSEVVRVCNTAMIGSFANGDALALRRDFGHASPRERGISEHAVRDQAGGSGAVADR